MAGAGAPHGDLDHCDASVHGSLRYSCSLGVFWNLELPMTAFKRSQAKYVKGAYKITNWPEYEAGLRQRGSLTVWVSEDELKGWGPPRDGRRKPGGQVRYSNRAIEIALTVGMVFHLHWRQTEPRPGGN
jgi:hypothetical protein